LGFIISSRLMGDAMAIAGAGGYGDRRFHLSGHA
jgi:hypothetical protein